MLLRKLVIGASLCALSSAGCVAMMQRRIEKEVAAEVQKQIENAPVFKYLELKNQQRWEEALAILRTEAENPMVPDKTYVANVYSLLLGALGDVANFKGLQPGFDEEALQYFESAKAIAGTDETLQAQVSTMYAQYFSKSRRNRQALPYLREAHTLQEKAGNVFGQIHALDGLSAVYYDMGENELGDHYRQIVLTKARGYFQWPSSPKSASEWLFYTDLLTKHNDRIASQPRGAPAIKKNWAIIEPIIDKHVAPKYVSYFKVAQHLAIAGDHDTAAKLYAQGVQLNEKVKPELAKAAATDRKCVGVLLHAHAQRYAKALKELPDCEAARKAVGFTNLDPTFERIRGEIHEGNGQLGPAIAAYGKSVDVFEKSRASIPVEERASFYRSLARKSSWGLIRATTHQYNASRNPRDFAAALRASDSMRARQLGELTADRGGVAQLESLEQLRAQLGPGHALVSFVMTEREVIVHAVNATSAVASVVEHDGRLPDRLAALVARVGKGGSSIKKADLDAQMASIGRQLLAPVGDVVADQARLTVVPDGILNAFPVELLVNPADGRPLVDRLVVASVPSVGFLLRERPSSRAPRRMLALGDPAYKAPSGPVGYASEQDVQAMSRASGYLQYFRPLPETRSELTSISKLFEGGTSMHVGAQATESTLKAERMGDYSYLHFATHGVLGGEVPGMDEPALVLAAEDTEDGFLTASEAAALNLDADLTVLSACNTGSGRVAGAEGVMGMSRSFLLAGSRAVVVSLWPVHSKATEALMVRFYEHHRGGVDAGTALRQAKMDVMQTQGWEHPYYWAAFIVVGEGSSLRSTGTIAKSTTELPRPTPTDDAAAGERGLELTPKPSSPPAAEPGAFKDDYSIRSPFQ